MSAASLASHVVSTRTYIFTWDAAGSWSFDPLDGSGPLLTGARALPLVPVIPGVEIGAATGVRSGDVLHLHAPLAGALAGEVRNDVYCLADRVVVDCAYRADRDHGLGAWQVAGPGSRLAVDDVHVLQGQHGGRDDNGSVFAAADLHLNTATHNWTYAAALPRLLFRRGCYRVLVGGTRIAHDFGLCLDAAGDTVADLRFDYGGDRAPHPVAADTWFAGPRLQLQVTLNTTPMAAHAAFTEAMIADGIVAPCRYAPEDHAWRRPWYCTWADQMGIAREGLDQDQGEKAGYGVIKSVLDQDFVRRVGHFIKDHDLNIGTIIIDDGWQDYRGDWNLDRTKFPDMRGLVDELHELGFKVVLWWAPFITEAGAAVHGRAGWVVEPQPGRQYLDYRQPAVRAWAEAMLDTWFSRGPGGWDLDGLKLDFLLEKIYALPTPGDLDWRGEERGMHKLLGLIAGVLGRYKSSRGLLHVTWSPHNTPFCAAVHSEERFDRNLDYLDNRPALAEAVIPGTWYAPHFNYNPAIVPDFIRRVRRIGGIVQVGKLLSPSVTPEFIATLRDLLA